MCGGGCGGTTNPVGAGEAEMTQLGTAALEDEIDIDAEYGDID